MREIDKLVFCEGYGYITQHKPSFLVGKACRATNCLEFIDTDLCSPMSMESLGGSQYLLLFTDDNSCISWVHFLKYNSKTFKNFKRFKALVEK